jgi:PmbA protein
MSVQILGTFAAIFSGDFLYKGLTRLAGKVGQKISSDVVSILDAGMAGLVPHQFDAEGVRCEAKTIVERGVLKLFLQNRYTAQKTGYESTGNAAGGLESLPGVSPANMAWSGKISTTSSLLSGLDRGLLLKELHGASASPISGDFSYGALGYWVENGKIQYPVADITVAGNIFDLLTKIEGLGDDLRYFSPHMLGSIGGRSLLVSSLVVSGK